MIRTNLSNKQIGHEAHFRWRGGDVSRVEGFSDAVFGFALTLLVVSLDVPHTFQELVAAMQGVGAFGICFLILFMVWHRHYVFFRRYGLQDPVTIGLNGVLLFVILIYVYPLKFLFTLVTRQILHMGGTLGGHAVSMAQTEVPQLFLIYGAGFASIYALFALLHANALRHARALDLTEEERTSTRFQIGRNAAVAAVGGLSVLVAVTVAPRMAGVAGYVYTLVGVVEATFGTLEGNAGRRARESASGGYEG